MKEYIVKNKETNKIYLVKAKDVNNAMMKVIERYYNHYLPKETFIVRTSDSLHNEFGGVIELI